MLVRHYKSEEKLEENCYFYNRLLSFVESISGENRWWFKECFEQENQRYLVVFTSYITPEYRNFELDITVERINEEYKFTIARQVTDLA